MKRIIWVYGVLAGLIVTSALLIGTWVMRDSPDFHLGQILGYGFMAVACILIIVGMRKAFLDGHAFSFGAQFRMGISMVLIMSLMYTLAWMLFYHTAPIDFDAHYQAYLEAQWAELGQAELAAKKAEAEKMMEVYHKPLGMFFITLLEIFPLGLLAVLLTAAYFGRKGRVLRQPPAQE